MNIDGIAVNGWTKHTLTVTNDDDDDQIVHIGAHVWQDRTYGWYNTECSVAQWGYGDIGYIWDEGSNDTPLLFGTEDGAGWLQDVMIPGK